MTTSVLILVIIALLGNLFVLFMGFDKKDTAKFCGVISLIFAFCALGYNAQTGAVPEHIREKIKKAPTSEVKQCLMARFGITETVWSQQIEDEAQTPIELGVGALISFALVFSVIIPMIVRDSDNKTAKQANALVFALNAVAMAFLLSLAYGLQLSLLPWIKKRPVIGAFVSKQSRP